MRIMKTSKNKSGKSQTNEGGASDSVTLGDLICIKICNGSWWPAQVVDENSVSESIKPNKKLPGEVLVRLYGSYTYSYADPIKCRSEFGTMLEHNDGSLRKIFLQALEQDLPSTKSFRSKGSSSKSKAGTSSKNSAGKKKSTKQDDGQNKVKRQKQDKMLNDDDLASQNHEATPLGKSQELSSRRIRVMESLGLIAPAGSPFQKDGHNYNKSS